MSQETSITLAMGERGSSEMIYNGFTYRLRQTKQAKTYWTCKTPGCCGSCVLINDDVLKVLNEHTHQSQPAEKFKRHEFKFRIRELALLHSDKKPIDVFEMFLAELEDDAKEYVSLHRKFYTGYASSLRMQVRTGRWPERSSSFLLNKSLDF